MGRAESGKLKAESSKQISHSCLPAGRESLRHGVADQLEGSCSLILLKLY
jgi:hypothetical protein